MKSSADFVVAALIVLALVGMATMCGCSGTFGQTIKGFVDPYARNPDMAYEKLCNEDDEKGPLGAVFDMCETPQKGCVGAEEACYWLRITLDVVERVGDAK